MNVGELKPLTDDELRSLEQTGYAHPPIRVGDVVELASGGDMMTVSSIKDGIAHCVWFNPHSVNYINRTFLVRTLRKV